MDHEQEDGSTHKNGKLRSLQLGSEDLVLGIDSDQSLPKAGHLMRLIERQRPLHIELAGLQHEW